MSVDGQEGHLAEHARTAKCFRQFNFPKAIGTRRRHLVDGREHGVNERDSTCHHIPEVPWVIKNDIVQELECFFPCELTETVIEMLKNRGVFADVVKLIELKIVEEKSPEAISGSWIV